MTDFTDSDVFFHSADPLTSPWPYVVAAGGRTSVSGRDGMVSRQYHEHTLILTLSGQGRINVAGGSFPCAIGDIAWLDTSKEYQHGAQMGGDWRYVWVALSGFGLDRLHALIGLPDHPIVANMAHLLPCFEAIITTLAERPAAADAVMTAQVARIVSELFTTRRPARDDSGVDPVSKVMRHLRRDIARNWDIAAMADIAGLSPSQLFRRFKAASGTAPKSWLRQERMLLARHLLTATSDSISGVALRCGYADQFHFSRDFSRHYGCSPRKFRTKA